LTRSSDKLPALSRLAKHFESYLPGSTYMSGLWSDSLLEDLLWSSGAKKNGVHAKPRKRRAPSWSWAAIDGDVAYLPGFPTTRNIVSIACYAQVQAHKAQMIGINKLEHLLLEGPTLRCPYKLEEIEYGHPTKYTLELLPRQHAEMTTNSCTPWRAVKDRKWDGPTHRITLH
jgi:hypothetical protein